MSQHGWNYNSNQLEERHAFNNFQLEREQNLQPVDIESNNNGYDEHESNALDYYKAAQQQARVPLHKVYVSLVTTLNQTWTTYKIPLLYVLMGICLILGILGSIHIAMCMWHGIPLGDAGALTYTTDNGEDPTNNALAEQHTHHMSHTDTMWRIKPITTDNEQIPIKKFDGWEHAANDLGFHTPCLSLIVEEVARGVINVHDVIPSDLVERPYLKGINHVVLDIKDLVQTNVKALTYWSTEYCDRNVSVPGYTCSGVMVPQMWNLTGGPVVDTLHKEIVADDVDMRFCLMTVRQANGVMIHMFNPTLINELEHNESYRILSTAMVKLGQADIFPLPQKIPLRLYKQAFVRFIDPFSASYRTETFHGSDAVSVQMWLNITQSPITSWLSSVLPPIAPEETWTPVPRENIIKPSPSLMHDDDV